MRKPSITKRIISGLLACVMVFGLLPAMTSAAQIANTMVTDPSSLDSWKTMLGSTAEGNRYAGRIWSDKSVFPGAGSINPDGIQSITYDKDQFLVVYSTLGSTTSVSTETHVPGYMDIAIVLDSSTSMNTNGSQTRLDIVTEKANELIGSLLEQETNRLTVVTYNSNATTVLPLNHYEQTDEMLTIGNNGRMTANGVILGTNTKPGTTNAGFQSGTNLQSGINAAMKNLNNASDPTGRIPVLIVLTDGAANRSVTSGMIGDTSNSTYSGTSSSAGTYLSTVMNAAYWKYTLSQTFGTTPVVYTIGVDISGDSFANSLMDPATYFKAASSNSWWASAAETAYSWYIGWSQSSRTYTQSNFTFAQPSAAVKAGVQQYIMYADEYYPVDSADLGTAFDDILTKITSLQPSFHPITDSLNTNGDSPQTYVDFIGDYMEVEDFKGVTLYDKFYDVVLDSTAVSVKDGVATVTYKYVVGKNAAAITDPRTGDTFNISDVIDIELIHTYNVDANNTQISAGEQELWIRINEQAMPLIYHKVDEVDGSITYTVYEQKPLRVYYTVGISDYIAPAGNVLTHRIDQAYLDANTNTQTGEIYFYTNQYHEMNQAATGYGDAHVAATPDPANRYYFHQSNKTIFKTVTNANGSPVNWDESIYGVVDDGTYKTTPMTYQDFLSISDSTMVYTTASFRHPTGTGTATADGGMQYSGEKVDLIVYTTWGDLKDDIAFHDKVNNVYINSDGTTSKKGEYEGTISDYSYLTTYVNNTANISSTDIELELAIGSWRIPRLHNMTTAKTENTTGTATYRVAPTLNTDSNHEGDMVAWLGNNGRMGVIAEAPKSVYDANGNEIDGDIVMIGDELTYEINATNYETTPATIIITDTVPEGTSFVSASTGAQYDATTGKITWTIENVAVGSTVNVSFKVRVDSAIEDEIENTGYIQIGNNPAYETNTTVNPPMGKVSAVSGNASTGNVKVGDVITYQLYYYNNEKATASVTIRDTVPAGTTYRDGTASYNGTDVLTLTKDANQNVTGLQWVIPNVPSGASGSVTFQVIVNSTASTTVDNTATIQIGQNGPIYTTNSVENGMSYGDLELTKTVATGNAAGSNAKYFTLVLRSGVDTANALNGTYTVNGSSKVSNVTFTNGQAKLEIKHGESITIQKLPAGITVSVYEETADGYTAAYSANAIGIVANEKSKIDVTNTYNVTPTSIELMGSKSLTGRPLKDNEFSFVVYENGNVVSTGESMANGSITFKPITYTSAGTHTYTVKEVAGGEAGIGYDTTEYTVTVVVTDDGNGNLTATATYPNGGLAFHNTHTADPLPVVLEGTKVLTGRSLANAEFSFLVYEENSSNLVTTGENRADGTIAFKPIIFTESDIGSHSYVVSEINGGLKGVGYDATEFTVTINITQDAVTGELAYTVTYPTGGIEFNNTYQALSTNITLQGNKILTGHSLEDGDFSFVVYEGNNLVSTGTNKADGTITFRPITYTATGTHTYKVYEVNAGAGGITYDDTEYQVTVNVVDVSGQLTATISYPNTGLVFNNGYQAADTSVTLTGNKVLTGYTLSDSQFAFVVYEGDKLVTTGENDANGNIVFRPITYSAVGVHTYTVYEINSGDNGVNYDETKHTVTVTVTDNGEGQLVASVAYPTNGLVFNNSYKAADTNVTLEGKKVLTGGTLDDNDFSFVVYEGNNLITTGENKADGTIVFRPITYSAAGVHTYTVSEVNSGNGGVTFDQTKFTVTVTVIDDGSGQLKATVAYPQNGIVFNNTYKAADTSVTLQASKVLTGGTQGNSDFSFVVYEGNNLITTGENKADGTIVFRPITYSAAGIHTYIVSEVNSGNGGVTFDQTKFSVTVTVIDDGSGQLKATVSYPPNGIVFTNIYKAADTSVTLQGSKVLTGGTLDDNDFSFVVYEGDKLITTGENKADGTIVFRPITYSAAGVHTYIVSEVNSGNGGVTFDQTKFNVTVTVTDDGSGQLKATVAYPQNGIVFNNTYAADSTSVKLEGIKKLDGRPLKDNEFSFIVTEQGRVVSTGLSKKDGTIAFTSIYYASAGVHTYTISEVKGNLGGVTYTEQTYTATVTVTDNGEGQLVASVTYSAPVVFTNTYKPSSTSATFTGTKELNGRTQKDNEFSFIVTDTNGQIVSTGLSKKDGKIVFTPVGFTSVGVYTYAISEVKGNLGGVTYTDKTYTAIVTVTDNGEGSLVASVSYSAPVVFTNTYTPSGTSATLTGTKELIGRPLKDNEFSFVVTEHNRVVSTGLSKKDGKIVFTPIGFTSTGVHTYTISEVKGNLGGVTYTEQTYTATVTVTDNGEGQLVASVTYSAPVVFTNTYKPSGTSATFTGTKELNGRTQKDNEFAFIVTDGNGQIVSTGLSKKDGKIVFTPVSFTSVGVYTYTISEVKGNLGGVTYTEQTYTATVTVTDNGEGSLVASVSYSEPVKFVNTYKPGATSATFTGTKVLNGRSMADNEFSFAVTDANGKVVSTGLSKKDGTIVFTPIGFTTVGTYTYTISEVKGNLGGVTYTNVTYTATVTVTDNGEGSLVANISYSAPMEFVNSYKADSTSAIFQGTKELTGRPMTDNEFSFIVINKATGKIVSTGLSKANGSITFTPIGFDTAGVYNFEVSEVIGRLGGVTYSTQKFDVTVTVTDNGSGLLTETITYPAGGIQFKNTYTAEDTSYTPSANKVLNGREMKDNEFSFVIKEGDVVVSTGLSKADGTIVFTPITYTTTGVHTYVMSEIKGNLGGVNYDTTTYTFQVTVTDNGTGNLVATATDATDLTFTNTYTAASVDVKLNAVKNLSKKVLAANEFSFVLKNASGTVIETVTNKADGTVSFGTLTFNKVGVYTYTISEVIGTDSRYTYDTSVYTAVIDVKDDGNGKLYASVTFQKGNATVGAPIFNNDFTPASISLDLNEQISFTKSVVDTSGGNYSPAGFTFQVYDWSGKLVTTGTSDATGYIDFKDALTFTTAGDYRYRIVESTTDKAGITIDSTVWVVHVAVSYNATTGILSVDHVDAHILESIQALGLSEPEVEFVNTYNPDDATLNITVKKELNGRDLVAGEFTFQLIQGNQVIAQATNDANGNVTFTVSYDKIGVYNYDVREVTGTLGGVTYDKVGYALQVTVTDLGGKLDAKVTSTNEVTFKNTYLAKPVSVTLGANKVLYGRPIQAGEFTFVLTDEAGNTYKATNNAAGIVTFEELTFTEVGKRVFTYSIKEETGDLGGITYSDTKYTATVNVWDDGVGQLHAAVTYTYADSNNQQQPISKPMFFNSYEAAPVTVVLGATKSLSGRDLINGEFEFLLNDNTGSRTATNKADGTIRFDAMTFDEVGSYEFTLTEKVGTKGGVTYDTTSYPVKVEIKDNLKGNLEAIVSVNGTPITVGTDGSYDLATFNNTYATASVDVVLKALKELTGRDLKKDEFTFVLTDESGKETTVTNAADGSINLGTLTYSKAGTYTYTLTEKEGNLGGITYDKTKYTVTVYVADDLNGKLVATVSVGTNVLSPAEDGSYQLATFLNKYSVGSLDVTVEASKELTGNRDLVEDEFTFVLTGNGIELETTNKADGKISFTLNYTKAGTYTYTLAEKTGELGGITYDKTVHTVTVVVTDNLDGTLSAKVSTADNKPLVFTNSYKAESVTAALEANKILTGRDLVEGEFTFLLTAVDGSTITATNTNNGLIVFEMSFGKVGTYTYTATEIKGNVDNVTYDETAFTVVVTVADDGNGKLFIETLTVDGKEAQLSKSGVVFNNQYQVPDNPKTGDDFNAIPAISLMIVSFTALVVLLFAKKKNLFE